MTYVVKEKSNDSGSSKDFAINQGQITLTADKDQSKKGKSIIVDIENLELNKSIDPGPSKVVDKSNYVLDLVNGPYIVIDVDPNRGLGRAIDLVVNRIISPS